MLMSLVMVVSLAPISAGAQGSDTQGSTAQGTGAGNAAGTVSATASAASTVDGGTGNTTGTTEASSTEATAVPVTLANDVGAETTAGDTAASGTAAGGSAAGGSATGAGTTLASGTTATGTTATATGATGASTTAATSATATTASPTITTQGDTTFMALDETEYTGFHLYNYNASGTYDVANRYTGSTLNTSGAYRIAIRTDNNSNIKDFGLWRLPDGDTTSLPPADLAPTESTYSSSLYKLNDYEISPGFGEDVGENYYREIVGGDSTDTAKTALKLEYALGTDNVSVPAGNYRFVMFWGSTIYYSPTVYKVSDSSSAAHSMNATFYESYDATGSGAYSNPTTNLAQGGKYYLNMTGFSPALSAQVTEISLVTTTGAASTSFGQSNIIWSTATGAGTTSPSTNGTLTGSVAGNTQALNGFTAQTYTTAGSYYFETSLNTGPCRLAVKVGGVTYTLPTVYNIVAPVVEGAPTITTESLPGGAVGKPYSTTLAATPFAASDTVTWSISRGNLPTGLSLDASTGAITGTPTAASAYTFTVRATEGKYYSEREFTVRVVTPPTITTERVSDLPLGSVAATTFYASGSQPVDWSVATGALPDGMSLAASTSNASAAVLSGTPTKVGKYTFTLKATNTGGFDQREYTMQVYEVPVIDTSTALPNAVYGEAYKTTMALTDPLLKVTKWSLVHSLPSGLTLDPLTGTISGTPANVGTYSVLVTATTVQGQTASAWITINVYAKPQPHVETLRSVTVGGTYDDILSAGGSAPITWSLADGTLPPGLTLDASGQIKGTANASGTYEFTARATNPAGTADQDYSITVLPQAQQRTWTQVSAAFDAANGADVVAASERTYTVDLKPSSDFTIAAGTKIELGLATAKFTAGSVTATAGVAAAGGAGGAGAGAEIAGVSIAPGGVSYWVQDAEEGYATLTFANDVKVTAAAGLRLTIENVTNPRVGSTPLCVSGFSTLTPGAAGELVEVAYGESEPLAYRSSKLTATVPENAVTGLPDDATVYWRAFNDKGEVVWRMPVSCETLRQAASKNEAIVADWYMSAGTYAKGDFVTYATGEEVVVARYDKDFTFITTEDTAITMASNGKSFATTNGLKAVDATTGAVIEDCACALYAKASDGTLRELRGLSTVDSDHSLYYECRGYRDAALKYNFDTESVMRGTIAFADIAANVDANRTVLVGAKELDRTATMSGTVFEVSRDGTHGAVLKNARITVSQTVNGFAANVQSTVTDADGKYTIGGLYAGYAAVVTPNEYLHRFMETTASGSGSGSGALVSTNTGSRVVAATSLQGGKTSTQDFGMLRTADVANVQFTYTLALPAAADNGYRLMEAAAGAGHEVTVSKVSMLPGLNTKANMYGYYYPDIQTYRFWDSTNLADANVVPTFSGALFEDVSGSNAGGGTTGQEACSIRLDEFGSATTNVVIPTEKLKGGVTVGCYSDNSQSVALMLFDSEGTCVSLNYGPSGNTSAGTTTIYAKPGTYTLVACGAQVARLNSIATFDDLKKVFSNTDAYKMVEGIVLKPGQVRQLLGDEALDVPVVYGSELYITQPSSTMNVPATYAGCLGQTLEITGTIKLDSGMEGNKITDLQLQMMQGSTRLTTQITSIGLVIDGKTYLPEMDRGFYNFRNLNLAVPEEGLNYSIQFVVPSSMTGDVSVSLGVRQITDPTVSWTLASDQMIGAATMAGPTLTANSSSTLTSDGWVYLSGAAPYDSRVIVSYGGAQLAVATPARGGGWSAAVQLPDFSSEIARPYTLSVNAALRQSDESWEEAIARGGDKDPVSVTISSTDDRAYVDKCQLAVVRKDPWGKYSVDQIGEGEAYLNTRFTGIAILVHVAGDTSRIAKANGSVVVHVASGAGANNDIVCQPIDKWAYPVDVPLMPNGKSYNYVGVIYSETDGWVGMPQEQYPSSYYAKITDQELPEETDSNTVVIDQDKYKSSLDYLNGLIDESDLGDDDTSWLYANPWKDDDDGTISVPEEYKDAGINDMSDLLTYLYDQELAKIGASAIQTVPNEAAQAELLLQAPGTVKSPAAYYAECKQVSAANGNTDVIANMQRTLTPAQARALIESLRAQAGEEDSLLQDSTGSMYYFEAYDEDIGSYDVTYAFNGDTVNEVANYYVYPGGVAGAAASRSVGVLSAQASGGASTSTVGADSNTSAWQPGDTSIGGMWLGLVSSGYDKYLEAIDNLKRKIGASEAAQELGRDILKKAAGKESQEAINNVNKCIKESAQDAAKSKKALAGLKKWGGESKLAGKSLPIIGELYSGYDFFKGEIDAENMRDSLDNPTACVDAIIGNYWHACKGITSADVISMNNLSTERWAITLESTRLTSKKIPTYLISTSINCLGYLGGLGLAGKLAKSAQAATSTFKCCAWLEKNSKYLDVGNFVANTIIGGNLDARSAKLEARYAAWQQKTEWMVRYYADLARTHPDIVKENPWAKALIDNNCWYYTSNRDTNLAYPYRDPSGVIYEGVLSNTVQGATVTLYTGNNGENVAYVPKYNKEDGSLVETKTESGVLIPKNATVANDALTMYETDPSVQGENAQVTNSVGFYQWFVPDGLWFVKAELTGYESNTSNDDPAAVVKGANYNWLPVMPPQLAVNIGLTNYDVPVVQTVTASVGASDAVLAAAGKTPDASSAGGTVVVELSKYVQASDSGNLRITVNGQAVDPATIVPLNAEVSPANTPKCGGKTLASQFAVYVPGLNTSRANVKVSGTATSYAGVVMAAAATTKDVDVTGGVDRTALKAAIAAAEAASQGVLESETGLDVSAGQKFVGAAAKTALDEAVAAAKAVDANAAATQAELDAAKDAVAAAQADYDAKVQTKAAISSLGVSIDRTALAAGETAQASATFDPVASATEVEWTSSDPAVATVNALGKVTAVGDGFATIMGTSKLDATKSGSVVVGVYGAGKLQTLTDKATGVRASDVPSNLVLVAAATSAAPKVTIGAGDALVGSYDVALWLMRAGVPFAKVQPPSGIALDLPVAAGYAGKSVSVAFTGVDGSAQVVSAVVTSANMVSVQASALSQFDIVYRAEAVGPTTPDGGSVDNGLAAAGTEDAAAGGATKASMKTATKARATSPTGDPIVPFLPLLVLLLAGVTVGRVKCHVFANSARKRK